MKKSKVDDEDVLEAARMYFGLEKMKDIKYAILEKGGDITIIPYRPKTNTRLIDSARNTSCRDTNAALSNV